MGNPLTYKIGRDDDNDSDAYMLDDSMYDIFLIVFGYSIAEQN